MQGRLSAARFSCLTLRGRWPLAAGRGRLLPLSSLRDTSPNGGSESLRRWEPVLELEEDADAALGDQLGALRHERPVQPDLHGQRVVRHERPDGQPVLLPGALQMPGAQRGAVRSLGASCRIDHPEYLGKAFQELADTHGGGTYKQRIQVGKTWDTVWTALGNQDRDSRTKLRDPHRSNMRRLIFCFKELPEPVTIWIDDIAHSRWNRHSLPYRLAE